MLILIAESKTMAACDAVVEPAEYMTHRPLLENDAEIFMDSLRDLTVTDLAEMVKISVPMAAKLHSMIYEFPNKSTGDLAIDAFTGVVFKAFDYNSLPDAAMAATNNRVRIISSLYGLLRPDDVIKSYRFDFTTRHEGLTLAMKLRANVTQCLVKEIKRGGFSEILNLLPSDAERCIDWEVIREYANIYKADFREIATGSKVRTPHANSLKTLRGRLLRQIIAENISDISSLVNLESDNYICEGADECRLDTIVFLTARK